MLLLHTVYFTAALFVLRSRESPQEESGSFLRCSPAAAFFQRVDASFCHRDFKLWNSSYNCKLPGYSEGEHYSHTGSRFIYYVWLLCNRLIKDDLFCLLILLIYCSCCLLKPVSASCFILWTAASHKSWDINKSVVVVDMVVSTSLRSAVWTWSELSAETDLRLHSSAQSRLIWHTDVKAHSITRCCSEYLPKSNWDCHLGFSAKSSLREFAEFSDLKFVLAKGHLRFHSRCLRTRRQPWNCSFFFIFCLTFRIKS